MVKTRRIYILGSLKNTFNKTLKKIRGNRKTKSKSKSRRVKHSSRKTKRRKSKGGDPNFDNPNTIVYKGVKGLKSFAHSNYNPIRLVSKGVKGAYSQASDFIGNKYDEFKYGKNTPE